MRLFIVSIPTRMQMKFILIELCYERSNMKKSFANKLAAWVALFILLFHFGVLE